MTTPPTSDSEPQRLAALARYNALDTLPESEYDDMTRLAASICATPFAMVSLVDAERQWFKARIGLDVSETPRNISFCTHAIAQVAPTLIVDDARADERFADNPLVTGEPFIRFYAGAQLRTSDGFCIGTLCVADRTPRSLNAEQQEALVALARSVMRSLEMRRAVAELQAANARLRVLETAISDTSDAVALFEIDPTDVNFRRVRFVNAAFTEMMGYTSEEVVGQHPAMLLANSPTDAAMVAVMRAYTNGTPLRIEIDKRHKNGTLIPVEVNLSPVGRDTAAQMELWVGTYRDLTAQKWAEKTAAKGLESSGLIEQMPAILYIADGDLRFTASVGAGLRALDLAPGQVVGTFLEDFYGNDPRAEEFVAAHSAVLRGEVHNFEHRTRGRGYRTFLKPLLGEHGNIVGVIGISLDITDHDRDRHALVTTESKLLQAQRTAQLGSWETDLRTGMTVGSQELFRLYDLTPADGRAPITSLRARQLPEYAGEVADAIERARQLKQSYSVDFCIALNDGGVRWLQERGKFQYDCDNVAIAVTGTSLDISDRKSAEAHLKRLAHEDALTGLPNRTRFGEHFGEALARQANGLETEVAVLLIDVDDFKTVNDTLGHRSGDLLLREAAQRILESSGPGDVVARAGGDEFMVLTCGGEAHVMHILEQTIAAFGQPFCIASHEIYCTLSIGVTRAPDDGTQAEELLRNVDTAMYAAKASGRDAVRFFIPDMHHRVARRLTLENDLRRAIERGEFVLHYQPTFDRSLRMTGVEALIRWQHPSQGLVAPDDFIPIAEETGLIVPIGAWVIRTACDQLAQWSRMYGGDLRMAINISGRQLVCADLITTLRSAVAATGLDYARFTLELTESVIMADVHAAIAMLTEFKALGFALSVDDFGTGYSSLSSLKHLPIETLKIDRSFIRDTPEDVDDCAIVDAVIALGRSLDLTLLAEGVETPAQLAHLLERGCDEFQGYLLGRPQPAHVIETLLAGTFAIPR